MTAVSIPALFNCAKGFPASTPSSCFSSPTSTMRGSLSEVAIRSRPRICSLEASEDSSTTSTVPACAARSSRRLRGVARPSTTPV